METNYQEILKAAACFGIAGTVGVAICWYKSNADRIADYVIDRLFDRAPNTGLVKKINSTHSKQ